jgi:hypothetical protein
MSSRMAPALIANRREAVGIAFGRALPKTSDTVKENMAWTQSKSSAK